DVVSRAGLLQGGRSPRQQSVGQVIVKSCLDDEEAKVSGRHACSLSATTLDNVFVPPGRNGASGCPRVSGRATPKQLRGRRAVAIRLLYPPPQAARRSGPWCRPRY